MGWLAAMGGAQGKLGTGPTPAQTAWASAAGASTHGLAEYAGLVKAVSATRVADDCVQRSGQRIGSGQFGAVSSGTYQGRPLAIKSIGLSGQAVAQSTDQFFRQVRLEIEAMSELGVHPNIMQFFGSTGYFPQQGERVDALLIELLLELAPNVTLFDNLHTRRRFEQWPEKMHVLCGIAHGVEYLHSQSIVHRDLSSLNILFSADWVPKIADFGCARKCTCGYYDPQMVLGSPAYMSPEQLVGSKLSTKSDVWALGVLIWEVIAERGPWGDRNSNDRVALKHHIVDQNGKLAKINSTRFEVMYATHYEAQVQELLASCFRVTPANRCSASEVVKALAAINGPTKRKHVTASGQAVVSPPVAPMAAQQNGSLESRQQHSQPMLDQPPPQAGCSCLIM